MVSQLMPVVDKLRSSKKVVVLSGAGISKESGIPTFRDAQTGMWANYDPQKLATVSGFLSDPPLVWQWYDMRREIVGKTQPNAGHLALVQLESVIPSVVIVTQNIDGLHARAGSSDIIELHGNILRFKCFGTGHLHTDVPYGLKEPPHCQCGSMLRPDVVWFGENLPELALQRAFLETAAADVVLVVGTSGLVQPAASLPFHGKRSGACVVEVNPEETPLTDIADFFLQGPSGEILPQLIQAL